MTIEKLVRKFITPTNHNRSQLLVTYSKRGRNRAYYFKVRWFCFSLVEITGARFLSQSLGIAIAIALLLSTVT